MSLNIFWSFANGGHDFSWKLRLVKEKSAIVLHSRRKHNGEQWNRFEKIMQRRGIIDMITDKRQYSKFRGFQSQKLAEGKQIVIEFI